MSIWGGEPFNHPDALIPQSLDVISHNINPSLLKYPGGVVIYPMAIAYAISYLVLKLGSVVPDSTQFKLAVLSNRSIIDSPLNLHYALPGHLVIVLFALVGVFATYQVTYRLTNQRGYALISGLFLSTSLLWVVNTHYPTVDIPMTALGIATIGAMLVLNANKASPSFWGLAIPGILWGVTASAKWTGIIIGVSLLLPIIFWNKHYRQGIKNCGIVITFALLVFLFTNPLLLFHFKDFIAQFSSLLEDSKQGWYGHTTTNAWLFHLTHSLNLGYGVPLCLLALLGLIAIAVSRQLPVWVKLMVLAYPLVFFLMIGRSSMGFHRYILPIFPFLAIYSAYGCKVLYDFLASKFRLSLQFYLIIITVLATLGNVYFSMQHNLVLGRIDTRQQLLEIINQTKNLSTKPLNSYAGGYLGYGENSVIARSNLKNLNLFSAPAGRKPRKITQVYEQIIKDGYGVDLLFFDSFSHDPVLYSDRDFLIRHSYPNLQQFQVLQISPFIQSKERTPFSPESTYSPFLPDLPYRRYPGPFIEIYSREPSLINQWQTTCKKLNFNCQVLSGDSAYYLWQINQKLTKVNSSS